MATDRPPSARPSSRATKGRISLYVPEGDGRRIRAAFTRSSVRAEHLSFSDWATGVLLAAVAELERRENGGRPFPGGEAGEIGAGRPLGTGRGHTGHHEGKQARAPATDAGDPPESDRIPGHRLDK